MSTATMKQPVVARTPARGGAFASTGRLTRFALRRDRLRIGLWTLGISGSTLLIANSFTELYATAADRAQIAQTMRSPAALAMTGPAHYLDGGYGLGAIMAHQMLGFSVLMVALMSVLTVVRHSRTEEETGRAELVRATVVGRHAHLMAAINATLVANLVVGLVMALGLGALDIDGVGWEGSMLYGAAHIGVGIAFVGIAAVAVQITEHSRGAIGIGLAAVAVGYALRASGDASDSAASWLSPFGWAQRTWAYLDNRWWPLLLMLALGGIGIAVGFVLSLRRDVGSGLRHSRPGRADASELLGRPFGLAGRLQRGVVIGFAVATLLMGAMYGSLLSEVESMLDGMGAVGDAMREAGGATIIDSFMSMIMNIFVVLAAVFVVMATLRLRGEENAGRAESLLATPLSRIRWAGSHLLVAFLGGPIMLLLCALGFGLTGAAATGDSELIASSIGAALAYTPAVWLCAAAAVLFVGFAPGAAAAVWIVPVYAFAVGYLGALLQLPQWAINLSPFAHVPGMPVDDFTAVPLLVLTAVTAGVTALGLWGLRRRDLTTT